MLLGTYYACIAAGKPYQPWSDGTYWSDGTGWVE